MKKKTTTKKKHFTNHCLILVIININEYLRNYQVNKLTFEQSQTLQGEQGEIAKSELGNALKYMKNKKKHPESMDFQQNF